MWVPPFLALGCWANNFKFLICSCPINEIRMRKPTWQNNGEFWPKPVFLFYCHMIANFLWLKTKQIYFLTTEEVRSPKWELLGSAKVLAGWFLLEVLEESWFSHLPQLLELLLLPHLFCKAFLAHMHLIHVSGRPWFSRGNSAPQWVSRVGWGGGRVFQCYLVGRS